MRLVFSIDWYIGNWCEPFPPASPGGSLESATAAIDAAIPPTAVATRTTQWVKAIGAVG